MPSQPPPPKTRSKSPSEVDAKRADDVLDRMIVRLRMPEPTLTDEERDEAEKPPA